MYGYVIANKPELKFREFDVYRAYYCGLCDALGSEHGLISRMTLSYDFTFLVMLLTGLYEPELKVCEKRCMVHPVKKHRFCKSEITDYVADMNLLMAYYKCEDDWKDDRKLAARAEAAYFKGKTKGIAEKYPEKARIISEELTRLSQLEGAGENNIDTVSACFGRILGKITAMKKDEWEDTLYNLGFFLGKFIYILDAYDDLDEDIKNKRFNVLKGYCDKEGFEDMILEILNSVMAQCARQFEFLPIIQDAEILKNIIYSGVWTRYEQAKKRRMEVKK